MKQKLTIIKVSGKIVEKPEALKTFVREFASIKGRKMLIHSGAELASKVGKKMGIKTQTVDGRPVVDWSTNSSLPCCRGARSMPWESLEPT